MASFFSLGPLLSITLLLSTFSSSCPFWRGWNWLPLLIWKCGLILLDKNWTTCADDRVSCCLWERQVMSLLLSVRLLWKASCGRLQGTESTPWTQPACWDRKTSALSVVKEPWACVSCHSWLLVCEGADEAPDTDLLLLCFPKAEEDQLQRETKKLKWRVNLWETPCQSELEDLEVFTTFRFFWGTG